MFCGTLKLIIRFVKFVFMLIIILAFILVLSLFVIYRNNLNKDNFINRNKLENMEAVQSFLEASFPPSEDISAEDIVVFTEEQIIRCFFDENGDVFYTIHEDMSSFSGAIVCFAPVTNPAFYGVQTLPGKLLETAWNSIAVDPSVCIIFWIRQGSLQNIEAYLFRPFL